MKIGIFLPFFFDGIALFSVSIVVFGIFECFVHIMGIKIFGLKKKYTPGMVTAITGEEVDPADAGKEAISIGSSDHTEYDT